MHLFLVADCPFFRIGTGSEVGLCVDAAKKLDKKARASQVIEMYQQWLVIGTIYIYIHIYICYIISNMIFCT